MSLVLALVPAGAQGQAQDPAASRHRRRPRCTTTGSLRSQSPGPSPRDVDPAITGYDLEYRRRGTSSWLSGPQDQSATSATIADLEADKNYYVRVRAQNSNGEGAWSQAGEGTTALYVGTLTAGGRITHRHLRPTWVIDAIRSPDAASQEAQQFRRACPPIPDL